MSAAGKSPSIEACIAHLAALTHRHGPSEAARRWVEWLPDDQARAFAAPFALQLARRFAADGEEGGPC